MKLLGTIKHNDPTRNDRVSLYNNGNDYVWAKAVDEEAYETDVPLEDVELAWGSDEWDLQLNAKMTLNDFFNSYNVIELFVVGTGRPAGQTLVEDDYCDLLDCLQSGLIRADGDRDYPSQDYFVGWKDLEGTVADGIWTWDGTGQAWDYRGNDYHKIQLTAS